jgi:threonine synthase
MRYVSTRGLAAPVLFHETVLAGLAPDGGLYVPEQIPHISQQMLENLHHPKIPYVYVAFVVLSHLADSIKHARLKSMIDDAYHPERFGRDIVRVERLNNSLGLLCLSDGPTLAFKDLGLQLLARLMENELGKTNGTLNILGATSGDTGSAAEYAVLGRRGVQIFMLSPRGRMSAFQQAQMYTIDDPHVHNLVIDGTFDDCQRVVKEIMGDTDFKERHRIGAVNSINWARIAAQVVYYFWGYLRMVERVGDPLDVAVPSGNFGNALAAYYACRMGLPIRRILIATNGNDVLDEVFKTGEYRVRPGEEVLVTSSPSMDIAAASNLERLLFEELGCNPAYIRQLMEQVGMTGKFHLGKSLSSLAKNVQFMSGSASEQDVHDTIAHIHRTHRRVIDPHTAVAMAVGQRYQDPNVKLLVAETASAAKFPEHIEKVLGFEPVRPHRLRGLEQRPQQIVPMTADPEKLKAYIRANDR